jgi:hypothetical protein
VNLNHKLSTFLVLSGEENSIIIIGDTIYGSDYSDYTLRQIGFRQGTDVEVFPSFVGGGGASVPLRLTHFHKKR